MPSTDPDHSTSWADYEEQGDAPLPGKTEIVDGDTKIVTEYKINDDGKKIKMVRYYQIEKCQFSKTVAKRKTWKKYGAASSDAPGPNPSNTIVAEEIFMQFFSNKEEEQRPEEDPLAKLKGQKIVKCRICKDDHWTTHCPYKDKLASLPDMNKEEVKPATAQTPNPQADEKKMGAQIGKYVPPSMREGANRRGDAMPSSKNREELPTIRVTNLSEDVRDSDLQELFRPFGNISRVYLGKDKQTGQSKGFAFISFFRRDDAARAIAGVNGYGYDNLILSVEWAKPSGTS